MRITVTTKGKWSDTEKWLKNAEKKSPKNALNAIGREGVASLKSSTPRDTGQTANGWNYKVDKNEVHWYNSAYPQLPVNIAMLLNYGHGTGTGGYVPARPFIKPVMDQILSRAGDRIVKEMTE